MPRAVAWRGLAAILMQNTDHTTEDCSETERERYDRLLEECRVELHGIVDTTIDDVVLKSRRNTLSWTLMALGVGILAGWWIIDWVVVPIGLLALFISALMDLKMAMESARMEGELIERQRVEALKSKQNP